MKLRWDYTNLTRLSPLAQRIARHQDDCSGIATVTNFFLVDVGLGANLHFYSRALCAVLLTSFSTGQPPPPHALSFLPRPVRLRTVYPWIWRAANETVCPFDSHSVMACYFPEAERQCPDDPPLDEQNQTHHMYDWTWDQMLNNDACTALAGEPDQQQQPSNNHINNNQNALSNVRAATTEFLFTRVSHLVQSEAERQLAVVFGRTTSNKNNSSGFGSSVPPNLITIHMRWGDKGSEMKLQGVNVYINAVHTILNQRKEQHQQGVDKIDGRYWNSSYEGVNIYLATEDFNALNAFANAAPPDWNVFVDDFFPAAGAQQIKDIPAEASNAGLVTLALLLISMEANTFILTTASNWSRLMNELRKNILDPRCGNCTMVVDLVEGEWR